MASKLKLIVEAEVKKAIKDLEKVNKTIKHSKTETNQFSGAFSKLGKSMLGLGAGIASVAMLKQVISETTEAYKTQVLAEQKLKSALMATQGAVGLSFDEMTKYATALSKTTTYSDESIISAEALMTTFTQIGKDVFPQAINSAADMSAMFGQDLQQSVIQLGTALNDPIAGVGRLKRIGISFTDTQKAMIEEFMAQNDIMSAQQVIIDELNAEFGGVAETIGSSVVGSTERLSNAWSDLKEQGGKDLLEALNPAINLFTDLINKMVESKRWADDLKTSYEKVADGTATTNDELTVLQDEYNKTNKRIQELQQNLKMLNDLHQDDHGITEQSIKDLEKENEARLEKIRALSIQAKGEAEVNKIQADNAEENKKAEEEAKKAEERKKAYRKWLEENYNKTKEAQKEILEKELARVEANLKVAKTTDWDYKMLVATKKMLEEQLGIKQEEETTENTLNEYQQQKLDLEKQIYDIEKQRIGTTGAERKYFDKKLKSLKSEYKELTKINKQEKKEPSNIQKIVNAWDKAQEQVKKYSGVINGLKSVYSAWDRLQQNSLDYYEKIMNEKIEIAQEKADEEADIINSKYEDQKQALQEALDNDVITKEEYNEKLKKLDEDRNNALTEAYKEKEDLEKKLTDKKNKEAKRRFETDKALQIVQATINGASAVIKALAELGPIAGTIAAVAIGATTAAQIALISSQKFVPLAEGGIVDKPTHALIGEGGEPEMVLPLSKAEKMGFGGKSNNLTINITGNIYGINDLYTQIKNGIEKLQKTGTLNKWQYT